jgi:probable HAF family extracellular repeat protein
MKLAERESLTKKLAEAKGCIFEVVDLGPFDHNRNDVLALNDAGECAGACLNASTGRVEAFRQRNQMRTMLGTLGGSFSIARGINNQGEIVGGSLTQGDENFHAFICRGQKMYDINDLLAPLRGWEFIQATGINSRGEIIGVGSHAGEDRIVMLRPKF